MNNPMRAISPCSRLRFAATPSEQSQNCEKRLNTLIFGQLLDWLGPDSESAGRKYELIRARLIKMFRARHCVFAEDLADITFERVANKLASRTSQFFGDPIPYFYGVAKKIYLEYLSKIKVKELSLTCWPVASIDNSDSEHMLAVLEKVLNQIPDTNRELILKYYTWSDKNKSDHRQALANHLGIGLNALRLRVHRIRKEIRKKMLELDEDLTSKH